MLAMLVVACSAPPIQAEFGHGVERDIGIYLVADASTGDVTEVQELFEVPRPDGRGSMHLPDIWSVGADYERKVIYVHMLPGTPHERREEIAALVSPDPRVKNVEFDVVIDYGE